MVAQRPDKAEATGSNPVGCTTKTLDELRAVEGFSLFISKTEVLHFGAAC